VLAEDFQKTGLLNGKHLFVADMFLSFWLYGDIAPLPQGAPWYYGGLSGFENANYLMVPLCPDEEKVRRKILQEIQEITTRGDISLKEIRRTQLYILLEISRG